MEKLYTVNKNIQPCLRDMGSKPMKAKPFKGFSNSQRRAR